MNSIIRLVALVAGLVFLLNGTPSWSQPFINPTASDENFNTAGGTGALQNVLIVGPDEGFSNTAFGANALFTNTTGTSNTATGQGALQENTTGNSNTASGAAALGLNTTGSDNTALGTAALILNATGDRNTAVGFRALQNSTGTKNIGIGYLAGTTLSSGNNNIYIGNQGNGVESQTIRVGTGQAQTFIAGIATTNVGGAAVEIDTTTGQLGIKNSSVRYKRDITPMGASSEKVLVLRPVTFAYKDDARGVTQYGLIAEEVEVAAVYPELVTRAATGEVQTVRYQELIPMLLIELQRQRQELAELRALVGTRTWGAGGDPERESPHERDRCAYEVDELPWLETARRGPQGGTSRGRVCAYLPLGGRDEPHAARRRGSGGWRESGARGRADVSHGRGAAAYRCVRRRPRTMQLAVATIGATPFCVPASA
jgi:hypothetical protein